MKSKLKFLIFLPVLAILILSSSIMAAETYMIDKAHSYVGFGVKHLVISTVKGNFTDFSGTINFDAEDLSKSSVDVKIKVASIDTDNDGRDDHLRNADFFDVENFPEMSFVSNSVKSDGDDLVLVGDLTMHGVTKSVEIPFEFTGSAVSPYGQKVIAFEAHTKISRKDFGMQWNKVLEAGGLAVGDEIKIELQIEAAVKK